MDFKMSEDDYIDYHVYPTASSFTESDLSELRDSCLRVLAPYIVDYLWHMDPFHLQIIPATRHSRGHLHGRLHYGDNIEDEWFCIALIFRLTALLDVVASLRDADGEILLIESADKLPQWAQEPELSDGRVFVYQGLVHLIPIARTPAELTPLPSSQRPQVDDAITAVTQYSNITVASHSVQNVIKQRLRDYPDSWSEQQHHSRVTVPQSVKSIVMTLPQMMSAAIRAFYSRDAADLRACRVMKHFPPTENSVTVRLRFSRCLYAMLAKPRYFPDKKSNWKLPLESEPGYKAAELGMKLTCGFEMLAEQASKRKKVAVGKSSSLISGQKFELFIKKLQDAGYFQGELEGSKKYTILYEKARQYYKTSTAADDDSIDLRFSEDILEMARKFRLGAPIEDSIEEDSTGSSDDESWLDVEPESFDALLRQHFKLESEKAEFSGSSVPTRSEEELPSEIKRFLQSLSDFDGIQINHQHPNSDDMINMDPDAFGAALNKALNLAGDNQGDEGSCSSDSNDENDDVIDLNRDFTVSNEMSEYFGAMKQELSASNVRDGASHGEGPEDWDKPLDVDSQLLKNLLESYQSQDGLAGPTSTLLEPLGLKFKKK